MPLPYQRMLRHDVHALKSVDRVLMREMIRLTESSGDYLYCNYTPTEAIYEPGTRPEMELAVQRALSARGQGSSAAGLDTLRQIVTFLSQIALSADDIHPRELVFGGTEESIVTRRTDWCTDLARAGCVMLHIDGVAARLVCLFDTVRAYSGHQIIEANIDGSWACAGPVRGYVFQHSDGRPASARDLVNDQSIAIDTIADAAAAEAYNGLFSNVFLVNYGPELFTDYDFTESKADAYNLSILDESLAGWPAGLRWLHGEDE